jgi:hypothetical protein
MIQIETILYIQYQEFYGAFINRMLLRGIKEKKQLMVNYIKLSTQRLFIIQESFGMILILLNILNGLYLE